VPCCRVAVLPCYRVAVLPCYRVAVLVIEKILFLTHSPQPPQLKTFRWFHCSSQAIRIHFQVHRIHAAFPFKNLKYFLSHDGTANVGVRFVEEIAMIQNLGIHQEILKTITEEIRRTCSNIASTSRVYSVCEYIKY
jgi:hypothetical protein